MPRRKKKRNTRPIPVDPEWKTFGPTDPPVLEKARRIAIYEQRAAQKLPLFPAPPPPDSP